MTDATVTFAEYLGILEQKGTPFLIAWPEETRETARQWIRVHMAMQLFEEGVVLDDGMLKFGYTNVATHTEQEWEAVVDRAVKSFLHALTSKR